ncbi:MAG: thymidine phosphorylase [Ignavibacteriaceae bacterium]|nr:thymidine phosphorylase [Ignavibacteriaceae bacterium]
MNTVEIIRKKRNNKILTNEEIIGLISWYTEGKIPDYQFSAFLMAAYIQGMNKEETAAMTRAMLFSGKIMDLSIFTGAKVDKHSTGGVGDKTSLIIAPIVAAAGIFVPMISGRGLGHTGGTLDKLEAIPGFRTDLSLKELKSVLKKCGAVLVGQTSEIAPADKLIYSLRDVTATVESIPLITSSIMSKKLAEGIDGLVLDVKTGSGAFMRETKDAVRLAESLINTAVAFDKKVIAFITDMNQPLGTHIGNWLEIVETVKILKGEVANDLYELSTVLAGAMIFLGDKAASLDEGKELAIRLINNGKAFEKFLKIVKAQNGDISYLENLEKYPQPKFKEEIQISGSGYLKKIDNYEIGMAASMLGAGRMTKEDIIDPKAGIIFTAKLGNKINDGDVIGEIFSDDKYRLADAKKRILNALVLDNRKPAKTVLIKRVMLGKNK